MAATLEGLDVAAMGINCSLGPEEIFPLIEEMRKWTDKRSLSSRMQVLPDPAIGGYDMDAAEFGRQMAKFPELGVSILGGCCGTTPDFIAALAALPDANEDVRPVRKRGVCSASHMTDFGGVCVIGERINPDRQKTFSTGSART